MYKYYLYLRLSIWWYVYLYKNPTSFKMEVIALTYTYQELSMQEIRHISQLQKTIANSLYNGQPITSIDTALIELAYI